MAKRTRFDLLIPLLSRRRGLLATSIVAATIAQVAGIPLALLTRRLVDATSTASEQGAAEALIWSIGAVLVALTLTRGAARWMQHAGTEKLAQDVIAGVRSRMHDHLLRVNLSYLEHRSVGKILIRFTGDAASLRAWIDRVVVALPADVLTLLGVALALGAIAWPLLLVVLLPALLMFPLLAVIAPHARERTGRARREQARLTGHITDHLADITALRAARAERDAHREAERHIHEVRDTFAARGRLDATARAASMTLGSLALCAIALLGSHMLVHGRASAGDIVAAVWLALLIRSPLNRLAQASVVHERARVALERVGALLDRQAETAASQRWRSDSLNAAYTGERMRIRFKRCGWRDSNGSWPVRGLDATIQGPALVHIDLPARGAQILFELLLRLRSPREGRIALDGTNAKKLDRHDIRTHIGWVDHRRRMIDAVLRTETPATLRAAWASAEPVCPSADLDRTIAECDGHAAGDSRRGDPALCRLAIAVAMLNDPRVLLVNEPTAGLNDADAKSVALFLRRLASDRLVLAATTDERIWSVAHQRVPSPEESVASPCATRRADIGTRPFGRSSA